MQNWLCLTAQVSAHTAPPRYLHAHRLLHPSSHLPMQSSISFLLSWGDFTGPGNETCWRKRQGSCWKTGRDAGGGSWIKWAEQGLFSPKVHISFTLSSVSEERERDWRQTRREEVAPPSPSDLHLHRNTISPLAIPFTLFVALPCGQTGLGIQSFPIFRTHFHLGCLAGCSPHCSAH